MSRRLKPSKKAVNEDRHSSRGSPTRALRCGTSREPPNHACRWASQPSKTMRFRSSARGFWMEPAMTPNLKPLPAPARTHRLITQPPVITALRFSPDGSAIAVSGNREVLLHKADGSAILQRFQGKAERILSIAFSKNGDLLVAGSSAHLPNLARFRCGTRAAQSSSIARL